MYSILLEFVLASRVRKRYFIFCQNDQQSAQTPFNEQFTTIFLYTDMNLFICLSILILVLLKEPAQQGTHLLLDSPFF